MVDFTQIPLGNDALLALDDLNAASGYNRNLILPDDLPPILSLPQIQGPIKPRLVTGTDDGAVNVNVVNASSGGMPAVRGSHVKTLHDTFASSNAKLFFTQANFILIQLSIHLAWNLAYPSGFIFVANCEVGIADNDTGTRVPLLQAGLTPPNTFSIPATDYVDRTYIYPGGLNLHPALPVDSHNQYFVYLFGTVGEVLCDVAVTTGSS